MILGLIYPINYEPPNISGKKISRLIRGENNVPRARIELAWNKIPRDFKSLVKSD
jgi:hypothetical protein